MALIVPWFCGVKGETPKHIWYMVGEEVPRACPVCGAPNRELLAKEEWQKHPLYKWAKRKTSGR